MKPTAPCPSDWALERLLLGEAEESVHQHVTECAECTQRLSKLQRSGEDYMASAEAAALRSRIEAPESTSRGAPVRTSKVRRVFPASMLTAALAAAAAIALVIRAPAPPDDGAVVDLTAKGGEQFELWVERNATTVPLSTEGAARVNEAERLQASVGLDSARHVAVLVVTPSGDVVPLSYVGCPAQVSRVLYVKRQHAASGVPSCPHAALASAPSLLPAPEVPPLSTQMLSREAHFPVSNLDARAWC